MGGGGTNPYENFVKYGLICNFIGVQLQTFKSSNQEGFFSILGYLKTNF